MRQASNLRILLGSSSAGLVILAGGFYVAVWTTGLGQVKPNLQFLLALLCLGFTEAVAALGPLNRVAGVATALVAAATLALAVWSLIGFGLFMLPVGALAALGSFLVFRSIYLGTGDEGHLETTKRTAR